MEHGTIHRSPVNGQPEFGQDEIKQPNHYTWRGKECEQIIGDITQGSEQYIEMLIELKGEQNHGTR